MTHAEIAIRVRQSIRLVNLSQAALSFRAKESTISPTELLDLTGSVRTDNSVEEIEETSV